MNRAAEAARFFLPDVSIESIASLGSGNVNDTYTVTLAHGEKRILQRLNPAVFPDPLGVLHNMRIVLDHLRRESERNKGTAQGFEFITLYQGETGDHYIDGDGATWRLMNMIGDGRTCSNADTPKQAEELGKGLGVFHRLLSTLDANKLEDTLPGFHNTPQYLARYDAIRQCMDLSGQEGTAFCELFINRRRDLVNCLENKKKSLSHGVIHGDPKAANFLLAGNRDRVVSLIDLDTVKSGLLLHDLGDALRSACNRAGERADTGNRIRLDPFLFEAWLRGYLHEAGGLLSEADRSSMVNAVRLIGFELGLRFFTDHLEGNRYFKVRKPGDNLQRARVQFKLVESIEEQAGRLIQMANVLFNDESGRSKNGYVHGKQ